MHILKVVICFQLLPFIVGLSVDHCLGFYNGENICLFKVPPNDNQLNVRCNYESLEVHVRDHRSENPSDEKAIPSIQNIWDMCMHNNKETTVTKEPSKIHFSVKLNNEIKYLPDNYFCGGIFIDSISIYNTLLNDTRKLGLSSLTNCDAQCSPHLITLDVWDNVFEKVFNNSFCGLGHLKTLHLTSNNIKELESGAFINLKSLENMGLRNNSISVLPPGVFREQQNTLTLLNLDNNQLDSKSLVELKNLKQLLVLYLQSNRIDVLPKDVFEHMTQLEHLRLGSNSLKTLQGSLTTLKNLGVLSIASNHISVIHSEDFQNMVQLFSVDFSFNPITTVEPDFWANCTKISNVQISNALLTSVPNFVSKSTQLHTLDLSNNRIGSIDVGAFDAGEDIGIIDLSSNLLDNITDVFTKCTVQFLYLDFNRLTKFSFTDFSSNLTYLRISHNNISTIDTTHDINPQTLLSPNTLNQSNNHSNHIKDGSSDHLTMLTVLHLHHNKLRHISAKMFNNLRSLTELLLSHNQIQTIEPNAFPSQLETLHLDNNLLSDFGVWQLDDLTKLTNLSLLINYWSCDLSERMEKWLLKNSHIVEDICQIECVRPNYEYVVMTPHLSQCQETSARNLYKLNRADEINYFNGVIYDAVRPWLLKPHFFMIFIMLGEKRPVQKILTKTPKITALSKIR